MSKQFKYFFRRKGDRKWATHAGHYDDEAVARAEAMRMKSPSWEVKFRTIETTDEIL